MVAQHCAQQHLTLINQLGPRLHTLTQRAQAVLNDKSINAESRAIIRYGLEVNDPWLADLVRRAESSERIFDSFDFSPHESYAIDSTLRTDDYNSSPEKIVSQQKLGWRNTSRLAVVVN